MTREEAKEYLLSILYHHGSESDYKKSLDVAIEALMDRKWEVQKMKNSNGIDFGICYNDLTGGKVYFLYYKTRAGQPKLKIVHEYADGSQVIRKSKKIKDIEYTRAYYEYINN